MRLMYDKSTQNCRLMFDSNSNSTVARVVAHAAFFAVAWLSATGMASAQPTYRLVEVAPADATFSHRAQIDPTGTYVTGIASRPVPTVYSEVRVFLWSGGTSTYLAQGSGRLDRESRAFVNAAGEVVGT